MRNTLLVILVLLFFSNLRAQLPETDIYLFRLESNKEKQTILTQPLNITQRIGYDNQPSFSADEKKIFYVSVREDKQAEIYTYDIKLKTTTALTNSKESEYSPTLNPDNTYINAVVVEKDSSQRIHYLSSLNGTFQKKLTFDSVGYFTFLNIDTLLYYKLSDPHSLRYHVISSGEDQFISNAPIRGFKQINRHAFIYGIKDSSKVTFYTYDFLIHKAQYYCKYPSLNEDIIWHSNYGLIKSEGKQLLRYDEQKKTWLLLFDLGDFGIKKITRFIFDSKNKYLFVVNNL